MKYMMKKVCSYEKNCYICIRNDKTYRVMKKSMTKLEVFAWGMRYLGKKHGMSYVVEEMFGMDGYDLMSYGKSCMENVYNDVKELCKEIGLGVENISRAFFGVEVVVKHEWMGVEGAKEYAGRGIGWCDTEVGYPID